VLTVAASYWPRRLDETAFPVERLWHEPEPGIRVLVHSQRPQSLSVGSVVLVHGLEGSVGSGYMRGTARAMLERGYDVHRMNLRGCGTKDVPFPVMYHAGLTIDLHSFLLELKRDGLTPAFVAGFSLGGNLVLKLAAELGTEAEALLAGVCAVATPLDLEACAVRLSHRRNRFYERYFLRGLKQRIRRNRKLAPELFSLEGLDRISSVYEFDDRYTAPHFGFRDAAEYYRTQSATRFLDRIRVPTLLVQAKDDPLIPFEVFDHPAIGPDRCIELLATDHGGHLGYLARGSERFWLDGAIADWFEGIRKHSARKVVF